MKIGIITPYDAANYGAYLQAYANKCFIESLGHEVYMIKWRGESERRLNYFPKPKNWKHKIRLMQSRRYHNAVYKVMTDALKEFEILDYDNANNIDLFVLGSDEIWNASVPEFQNLIFYGKNKFDTRSVAYAPSISNAEYSVYESNREITECIKNVEIVGARDSRTSGLVEKIKGKKPNMVCDPTMLLKVEDYNVPDERIIKEKYILVYSYLVSPLYIEHLKRYAKNKGYKLVSACLYQNWCDENIVCSPLEFISLIRDAECVFTTTFHGSIFTLLNHKRCIIPTKMRKVKDLVEWTGMSCEVGVGEDISFEDFSSILEHEPDYGIFEKNVNDRREYSRKVFKEYIDRE